MFPGPNPSDKQEKAACQQQGERGHYGVGEVNSPTIPRLAAVHTNSWVKGFLFAPCAHWEGKQQEPARFRMRHSRDEPHDIAQIDEPHDIAQMLSRFLHRCLNSRLRSARAGGRKA